MFQPYSTPARQSKPLITGPPARSCDTYNDDKSITHIDWVDQQLEQLLHANKRAQKNIKATNAKNRKAVGGKDLVIPVGNLVVTKHHNH